MLATAIAAPAQAADWLKAESPNFIIYTDASAAAAQRYAQTLETFDVVLRRRHGIKATEPARRKLPIYLLRRSNDLRRIWPNASRSIAGFYTSQLDDTFAVATEDRTDDSTLLHEYVHHFMLHHFPSGYPAWLVEGFAEYYMTAKIKPDTLEIGNMHDNRASWLGAGEWIGFEEVLGKRPSELRTGQQVAMFYAQAWALTHYMMSDPARSKQLDQYVRKVAGGSDPVKTMTDITGQSPIALSRSVRAYLLKGFPYGRWNGTDFPTASVTITPVPAATAAVLLIDQRIKADNGQDAAEDRTDGPVLLADVRKAATPHVGDRLADLVLARAEIKLGDLAAAERLLARLREAHPSDAEVMEVSAKARLKAAEKAPAQDAARLRAEARAFAGKAHKADPNRYQTLIAYIMARQDAPGYPSDNDLEVYRDALNLAPQVDELRLNAAAALISRSKHAEAAYVLRPVALDPHNGEAAAAARNLLKSLEAAAGVSAAADNATP